MTTHAHKPTFRMCRQLPVVQDSFNSNYFILPYMANCFVQIKLPASLCDIIWIFSLLRRRKDAVFFEQTTLLYLVQPFNTSHLKVTTAPPAVCAIYVVNSSPRSEFFVLKINLCEESLKQILKHLESMEPSYCLNSTTLL